MVDIYRKYQEYFLGVANYTRRIKYYSATQFANSDKCPSSFEATRDSYTRRSNAHKAVVEDLYFLSI
jgi:hypothetical protein